MVFIAKVTKMKKLTNSVNGNPRFKFSFSNGKEGTTPVDAGWAYAITSHWEGAEFKVRMSGAGTIKDMERL